MKRKVVGDHEGLAPETKDTKIAPRLRPGRRAILKGTVAAAAAGLFALPDWVMPVLAQGETVVPFTDLPATVNFTPSPVTRQLDVRTITGPFTPKDQFFTTQHYGHPDVDPVAFRLKVTGLVERPLSLSLDDLHKLGTTDLVAGFECSGNRRPLQGLSSNGKWTGVPLKKVLDRAGVKSDAREFVFFGADKGNEDVEFRTQSYKVEQQFGRSLPREKALSGDPFLAWALNGEPLTKHQGAPLRLIVPGWYGVANVKYLANVHLQTDDYLGKYQARWYRTLRGETVDGEMRWVESAVTRMQLKSFIARVTTEPGGRHKVLGVVLNDGTPIKSVEVKVDEGPWQAATLDPATNSKYSWKLFTYTWNGATAGEHTLVSRVTDATGRVQPTAQELESKKTFLEDNSQYPRKVMIAKET
jgi:DMSO/TMAO reductase YedYZ molybdopterin-dependent catalytic subunit